MRKLDENRLAMMWAVRRHLAGYTKIWSGNEPFSSASVLLTNAIERAGDALEVQAGTSKGITNDGKLMRTEAIERTVAIAKCAKVYAMERENYELKSALNYAPAFLSRMSHHRLVAQLRTIVAAAIGVGEDLRKFGVTPEDCEAAMAAILALEQAQSIVRTAITGKKAVTQLVPEIMEMGREALTRMDNLIHLFESTAPDFVAGYRTARAIRHTGTRHKDEAPPSTEDAA